MTEQEIIFLWLDHIATDLGSLGTFMAALVAAGVSLANYSAGKKAARERVSIQTKLSTIATNVDGVVEKLSLANKTAGLAEGELRGRDAAVAIRQTVRDAVKEGVEQAAADPSNPISIELAGDKPR